jgi:hypothetical protein
MLEQRQGQHPRQAQLWVRAKLTNRKGHSNSYVVVLKVVPSRHP